MQLYHKDCFIKTLTLHETEWIGNGFFLIGSLSCMVCDLGRVYDLNNALSGMLLHFSLLAQETCSVRCPTKENCIDHFVFKHDQL